MIRILIGDQRLNQVETAKGSYPASFCINFSRVALSCFTQYELDEKPAELSLRDYDMLFDTGLISDRVFDIGDMEELGLLGATPFGMQSVCGFHFPDHHMWVVSVFVRSHNQCLGFRVAALYRCRSRHVVASAVLSQDSIRDDASQSQYGPREFTWLATIAAAIVARPSYAALLQRYVITWASLLVRVPGDDLVTPVRVLVFDQPVCAAP